MTSATKGQLAITNGSTGDEVVQSVQKTTVAEDNLVSVYVPVDQPSQVSDFFAAIPDPPNILISNLKLSRPRVRPPLRLRR